MISLLVALHPPSFLFFYFTHLHFMAVCYNYYCSSTGLLEPLPFCSLLGITVLPIAA